MVKGFLADTLFFKTQLTAFAKQSKLPIEISIIEYSNSPGISREGIRDTVKEKNHTHF